MPLTSKHSRRPGTRYSVAEAMDILTQCKLLRVSIDHLQTQALRDLRVNQISLVKTKPSHREGAVGDPESRRAETLAGPSG